MSAGIASAQTDAPKPGKTLNDPLTANELSEMQLYLRSMRNEKTSLSDRADFARILLGKKWLAVTDEFTRDLSPNGNVETQRAIARGLAAVELPPKELVPLLLDLLQTPNNLLRKDIATALAQYGDISLQRKLIDQAIDASQKTDIRIGAIYALAEYRNKEVVERLIDLIDAVESPIRTAAFASLSELTGLTDYGTDAKAWHQWWADKRSMSPQRFLNAIVRSISARGNELSAQHTKLIEIIVREKRSHYLNVVDEKRIPLLIQMLNEDLAESRMLAAKLASGRVVNVQIITEDLLTALRERFTDQDSRVRAAVAIPLGDLGDANAAKLAIQRLPLETEPVVQAAYLTLLAQVPLPGAVDPALQLLNKPDLTHAAANCLAAAYDAKLMSEAQMVRARTGARNHFVNQVKPEPAMIRLLGRIGTSDDTNTIVALLDHSEAAIRLAAAEAFDSGRLPLEPILKRISKDPTLAPIAIAIAGKHGNTLQTVNDLINSKPTDTKLTDIWSAAIKSVHLKLKPADQLTIDLMLENQTTHAELRETLLKQATTQLPNASTQLKDQQEMTIRLANLYLNTQRPAQAKSLYDKLVMQNGFTPEQMNKIKYNRLDSYLRSGEVDDAATIAKQILKDNLVLPEDQRLEEAKMIALFITVAQSFVNEQQLERSDAIIGHTRKLFGNLLTAAQQKILEDLHS